MSGKIRVLIIDDSAFMRNMLKRMIEKDARFEVIGIAKDGKEGVEKAQSLKPDVITMDVEMPVMTGLDALEKIMETEPTPVVMISTLTEEGARVTMQALDKGAVDFLPKALQDQEKNIMKSAGVLHEKLIAASRAKVKLLIQDTPESEPASAPLISPLRSRRDIKIVIVGSSTGGPKALRSVVAALPAELKIPVVIAQHMPPHFTRALAQRLDDQSDIKVVEFSGEETLEAGTVYIVPGGDHMQIQGTIDTPSGAMGAEEGVSHYKPSIEVLGRSALNIFGNKVLAVMLTGMGNDGASAFAAIKEAGGHVIAQDEASCVVYGMPRAVVEKGGATEVLSLGQIGMRIKTLLS
jgi:two-component system chemotaxis response regulator CheB